MNRTALRILPLLFLVPKLVLGLEAQEPPPAAQKNPQDAALDGLVAKMRAAEAAARRIRLDLVTEGRLPGGLGFKTKGSLRVLRSEQGELTAVHTVFDYTFDDGLAGRMESVKTPDGVLTLEQNPTFGEVFLRLDAALVADLEWAGRVLQRSDLPGIGDSRALAPLGSDMVADLAQRYALAALSHKDKDGQVGTWYGGDRRAGPAPAEADPDAPIADHVELFVREQDHALLEVAFLQAGKVVQRIKVDKLVVGEPMPLESFRLDAKGKKPKDAREHPPTWEQVQQILQRATAKADGELPPSARKGKEAGEGK